MSKQLPDWPKYLMRIDDQYKFMRIGEAGVWFDSGWHKVDIERFVLNEDLSVRLITDKEKRKISDLADAHSESK